MSVKNKLWSSKHYTERKKRLRNTNSITNWGWGELRCSAGVSNPWRKEVFAHTDTGISGKFRRK